MSRDDRPLYRRWTSAPPINAAAGRTPNSDASCACGAGQYSGPRPEAPGWTADARYLWPADADYAPDPRCLRRAGPRLSAAAGPPGRLAPVAGRQTRAANLA